MHYARLPLLRFRHLRLSVKDPTFLIFTRIVEHINKTLLYCIAFSMLCYDIYPLNFFRMYAFWGIICCFKSVIILSYYLVITSIH